MKDENFIPKRFDLDENYYDAKLLENVGSGKIHWHSHFLISLFKRNSGIQHLNNVEYKFSPGTAILLGPFDFHYNEVKNEKTFDAYSIKFTHKIFNENLYKICSLEHFPIVSQLSSKDYELAEKLCDFLIFENKDCNQPGQEMLIRNIIEQLVILIIRNTKKNITKPSSNSTIVKALIYIHDNFKENIAIKDVADVCHYTPNHFSFCFKKEMGVTFQNYLYNLRLEYAYNMIKYGKKSCSEACFESGFNSVEYFSSSFKKKYGHSPKFYI